MSFMGVLASATGLWIVVPDLASLGGWSGLAAEIGIIRGDLWAKQASVLQARTAAHQVGVPQDDVAGAARAALKLGPLRPSTWLVLAASAADPATRQASVSMSYLTGLGQVSLVPGRVALAVNSKALKDPAIRDFVSMDMHHMISKMPEGQSMLRSIFGSAAPADRALLRSITQEVDPNFDIGGPAVPK